MQAKVKSKGLDHLIQCDSAGTIDFHTGQPADNRMRRAASKRGYHMTSKARQINSADLEEFDHILTMDDANYADVIKLDSDNQNYHKIRPFCDFVKAFPESEVPDPYYGGLSGFDHVLDMLEDGCDHFLKELED